LKLEQFQMSESGLFAENRPVSFIFRLPNLNGSKPRTPCAFPFDRKLESWKVGRTNTTIDLPPELVKEMKLRAVTEGRKLKDIAGEIFQKGLEATADQPEAKPRKAEMKFPLFGDESAMARSRIPIKEALRMEEEAQTQDDHEQAGLPL
jgi:hypothetical protein